MPLRVFSPQMIIDESALLGGKTYDGAVVLSDTGQTGTIEVRNVVVISQANYDSLGSKDSETLYFIT